MSRSNDADNAGFRRLREAHITIVGLGLMGGSLGLALRARGIGRRIWGVARRDAVIRRAVEMGAVDGGSLDLIEGVAGADIVVLATPVRAIIEILERIGPHLQPGCLVIDLGSTKAEIVRAMAQLPPGPQPVGGHPMCGKEVAGIAAAEATLYEGAVFPLIPLERTEAEALATAETLVEAVGATPIILDAERHDRLVAAISHLPYLVAATLVRAAADVAAEDPLAWTLAASGFRDTSRLAASDVTMMLDILITNRKPVLEMLQRYREHLECITALLAQGDDEGLRAALEQAWQDRYGVVL